MTVGAVLEKSEEELLALRNFGRKSYDELRDKLVELGLLSGGRWPGADDGRHPGSAAAGRRRRADATARGFDEERRRPLGAAPLAEGATEGLESSRDADGDDEEEVPEWKRRLIELTNEEEA